MTSSTRDRQSVSRPLDLAAESARVASQPIIQLAPQPLATTLSSVLAGWGPRHGVATLLLTPITWWLFNQAAGNPLWHRPAMALGIATAAVFAALLLVTYLPQRTATGTKRVTRAFSSPCARMAGIHVATAAMLLSMDHVITMAILANVALVAALYQRTTGACAVS